jgi:cytochrome c oxidase assembly protein subunit 15
MTTFQRLCIATCVIVFALIVIGGIVRATDSGLGCPDWPTCHGSLIPKWEKHTLIEYSHRATATLAGFFGLALLVVAWTRYRHIPAIFYPTCVGFVFGLAQAALGGAVVLNELPTEIVVANLAMALTILTMLVLLATTVIAMERGITAPNLSPTIGRLAVIAAVGVLALSLVGSYVSGAGYALACSGWPLCNGEVVPSQNIASVQMIFLHRVLALVVGAVLVALAVLAVKARREAPLVSKLAVAAVHVYVVQAIVGAANVWTQLADGIAAAHLGLAALLWLIVALINIHVHRLYAALPYENETRATAMARLSR